MKRIGHKSLDLWMKAFSSDFDNIERVIDKVMAVIPSDVSSFTLLSALQLMTAGIIQETALDEEDEDLLCATASEVLVTLVNQLFNLSKELEYGKEDKENT